MDCRYLLCLLLAGSPCVVSAQADACTESSDLSIIDVYDPDAALATRQAALRALLALPEQCDNHDFDYTIGQLFRHGPDLPGNLVARDTSKAAALILAAAEDGHLYAYADLAEMNLKDGLARDAMKWAQVYLYLLTRHSASFDKGPRDFERRGYNADLLYRVEGAWRRQKPALDRALIGDDLRGYLKGTEATIVAGLARKEKYVNGDDLEFPPIKWMKRTCHQDLGRITGAYAMYLLEVQPTGKVSRVVLENFAPDPIAGVRLRGCVDVQFEPFAGADAKVGRMPIVYGYSDGPGLKINGSRAK